MIHEYFPPEAIALRQELEYHPDLKKRLAAIPEEAPPEERFATVLAYCGMAVDGYYNNDQMAKLFSIAIEKLRKKRIITVQ